MSQHDEDASRFSTADTPEVMAARLWSTVKRELGTDCSSPPEDVDLELVSRLCGDGRASDLMAAAATRLLGAPVYEVEVRRVPRLTEFAGYLFGEMRSGPSGTRMKEGDFHSECPESWRPVEEGRTSLGSGSPVFLLSAPRSGSTLLRVLLGGHLRFFAPPELNLLPFQTMAKREKFLVEHDQKWMKPGLVVAIAFLEGKSREEARCLVTRMIDHDWPTVDVYRLLMRLAGARRLVDKSPAYAADARWLARAEELFSEPLYVHLVRHPQAVIESFTRMRFHRLLGSAWKTWDQDPFRFAEKAWTCANENIREFLASVPQRRKLTVSFEQLVSMPRRELERVCSFLGAEYGESLLDMSVDELLMEPPGDPNFSGRTAVDPSLATAWRDRGFAVPLSSRAEKLAELIGYSAANSV